MNLLTRLSNFSNISAVGASRNPCSEAYAGTRAFSEVETRTMSDYISSISTKLFAYISFHSYSQFLMFPYGHSKSHLGNYDEQVRKANMTLKNCNRFFLIKYVLNDRNCFRCIYTYIISMHEIKKNGSCIK